MDGATTNRRRRDRDATAQSLLAAAKALLAEEGFAVFGVNAVARRAGCDKQLIYRYFGGLEGLAAAMGEDLAATFAANLKPISPAPVTYADLASALAVDLLRLLRSDPLLRQIAAWEVAAPSPLIAPMAAARSRRLAAWMQDMRGDLTPPPGVDPAPLNALLIAAVQQLALAGAHGGSFAGLALKSDADWSLVEDAVRHLAQAAFRAD